ncbi:EMC3/TMCO1 family protein [archaeon]|nr:EMC3/TMCO1 family protein [archaeon]
MALLSGIFDPTLGALVGWNPVWGLIVISFIMTLLSTLAYKYFTDQKYMKREKAEIKIMSKEMKELKDQPDEMMKKQKELMERNMKMMKHSFRPMLFTIIPFLVVFNWLNATYEGVDINFLIFHSWLWVYIIFSIILSMVLRKVMKVY